MVTSTCPDGASLATTSADRTLRLWDLASGQVRSIWTLHGGYCMGLDFSPDGRRMVLRVAKAEGFGSDAPTVEIWDVEQGRQLLVFRGYVEIGFGARFSPEGRRLVTDWWHSKLRQWEAFPWRDADYHGLLKEPLSGRIRTHAERYWRDRLEAERAMADTNGTVLVTLPLDHFRIPVRDLNAPAQLIDLTEYYTGSLDRCGYLDGDGARCQIDLRNAPKGVVTFHGVPFDLRGLIQLTGANTPSLWEPFPAPPHLSVGRNRNPNRDRRTEGCSQWRGWGDLPGLSCKERGTITG
jgi:hypothetical protein